MKKLESKQTNHWNKGPSSMSPPPASSPHITLAPGCQQQHVTQTQLPHVPALVTKWEIRFPCPAHSCPDHGTPSLLLSFMAWHGFLVLCGHKQSRARQHGATPQHSSAQPLGPGASIVSGRHRWVQGWSLPPPAPRAHLVRAICSKVVSSPSASPTLMVRLGRAPHQ